MKKQLCITISILLLAIYVYPQNEANLWYFGRGAEVNFNSGDPIALDGGGFMISGNYFGYATMCDTLGNMIIISSGEYIYNKNKEVFIDGDLPPNLWGSDQGCVILQKPENTNLYYIISIAHSQYYGMYYSIVDMSLNNGDGAIIEKNIPVIEGWDSNEKIIATKHDNGSDIWIITRKYQDPAYAAFLLTPEGLNTTPILSPSFSRTVNNRGGSMKISHDKRYLVAAYSYANLFDYKPYYASYDICKFNASTGEITFQYVLSSQVINEYLHPNSVEFSPDSKYLFLSHHWSINTEEHYKIYQYDMAFIDDSTQFVESSIQITDEGGSGLQLARDGKIYCGLRYWPANTIEHSENDYLNVINRPWKKGADCYYEKDAVDLLDHGSGLFMANVLIDYLFRFEWQGRCSAEPFIFQSNFQPDPVYIRWSFGDPEAGIDSISYDLNPAHYFTQSGEFEVKVIVRYPSGREERTSRVVTVVQSPMPNLGSDTLMCAQGEITLNAGDEEGFYLWSNGSFGQNANELVVSDTGWYWVDVTNSEDCTVRDSIHVGLYPKAVINEDNLNIIPTTCSGSSGKILGLEVIGEQPLSFEWYDAEGNLIGTTLDIIDLPVGNYFLHILDGNGCRTISDSYTIIDAGDIEITEIERSNTHCGQETGTISITANSGSTEDLLYSIDNGNTWQTGNPLFENLPSGNYFVRVKDQSGCEGVYENNPVTIENIDGPQITIVSTVPEIDYLSNGQINITATIGEGQLYYSINNGTTFQTDNGQFINLSAGTYNCLVKDDFGCNSTFTVEVERIFSQIIEAIAGDGNTCIGNAAVVPLKLNNFTDIYKFHVLLTYDTSLLTCDGYLNVHPVLEPNLQASIIPGTDEVVVSWQGASPATLEESATMLELVFGAKEEGMSGIDWVATPDESAFYNEQLEEVSAEYHLGLLRVYTRPQIIMANEKTICEGDDVTANVFIDGGSGEVDYFWEGPNGYTSTDYWFNLENVQLNQAGIYTLTVNDTIDCKESKEINLVVNENPQIAFADYDTLFSQPSFILEAGSGYESYLWNTNDTTDAIGIYDEGLYSVYVTSTESCESTDSVMVLWGGETFWLPNAFSPNGDGLNDIFKPVQRYDFVKSYYLVIYNRWGGLVFETNDINEGWDGLYKDTIAPLGTYVYKIVYTAYSTGKESQVKAGAVTLVR